MTLEQQLLQYLFTGITNGAIYSLMALGFVAVYSVTGIINFAQGEFAMAGALVAVSLDQAGLPLPASVFGGILAVLLIASLLERSAIHPARGASTLTLIIITIGLALAIRGIALLIWGTFPYKLPPFTVGPPLRPFGAMIRLQSLWVMGVTLLVLILLYLFFELTVTGKSLRACAINRVAARLMGIDPDRMSLLSFGLSGALGAVGGILVSPIIFPTYDMGVMLGLKGFVAAAMGGLASYPVAALGGLILGVVESYGAGLVASGLKDAIALFLLFVILVYKPGWLFKAEAAEERV